MAAALALVLAPVAAGAQVVKDTVQVTNQATVNFLDNGTPGSMSARATIVVRQLAGMSLVPAYDTVAAAGARIALPHTVTNQGTAPDAFTLSASGSAAWPAAVWIDVDGDGALGAADTLATAPVYVPKGGAARILLVVDVPAGAAGGALDALTVRAVSTIDPTVVGMVLDRIAVLRSSAPDLNVAKRVDRATATTTDTLTYTITVANRGGVATPTATVVVDTLPAGVRYVAGSLRLGAATLTDAADADGGSAAGAPTVVRVDLGPVAAGAAPTITFRAAVVAAPGTAGASNVAIASYADTSIASAATTTAFTFADLTLQKDIVGPDSAIVGGTITYRLSYRNNSTTTAALNVALVDTLPSPLQFVSADGGGTASGGVVTWAIGTLAPGAAATVTVVTRVGSMPPAGTVVVNLATLKGSNAGTIGGAASGFHVVGLLGSELALSKAASVFEVSVGDPVPYVLTLQNRGWTPLAGLVVRDHLPTGMRLAPKSVAGADSVRTSGQDVLLYWNGPLAAGATHVVTYTAILATPGKATVLANAAVASAENGLVTTTTATALVRVRQGYAMQGRTLVGKVWVDRNDDGRQEPGEMGVPGAQIVSADGQVVVTDREGRFSFRDLRPGTHALRLDSLGLPRRVKLARARDELVLVQSDGWTTPQVNFRLVPTDTLSCADDSVADAGDFPVRLQGAPVSSIVALPMTARAAERVGPMVPELTQSTAPAIAPLRASADHQAEEAHAFVGGQTVRLTSPADGAVVALPSIYVGVRGEAGALARLYDGDSLVAEKAIRPDGLQDFIGVPLAPGPHRLRVWMKNSFGNERWDSLTVHRSGAATRLEVEAGARTLRLDAPTPELVRLRVLDQWGAPLAAADPVTVDARGATIAGSDADPSSVGEQRAVRPDGTVLLALRAEGNVGPGELVVTSGRAAARIPLRILPSARALTAVGVGQVGVGAAPQSFGAVTVRGAVGNETSVSVSYDSRRGGNDNANYFGGGYNPLDESHYATYGDASERRAVAGTERFSMKVERGYDWLQLGDVQTTAFTEGDHLGNYQRSLNGVTGRLGTGRIVWNGFASVTQQALHQVQLRGDGGSGPYVLGGGIRAGTDRVALEVRDRLNAARIVAREELVRYTDYEIDYQTGAILLRRPVPSEDVYGNPMFVVATVEQRGIGATRLVGGVRAETDLARWMRVPGLDSLSLGVSGVHTGNDGAGATAGDLLATDVRVRRGGLDAGAELLHAQASDSAATAARARARFALPGNVAALDAEWMRIGAGFSTTFDPRLASALTSLRLGGNVKLSESAHLGFHHESQRFDAYGAERRSWAMEAGERALGRGLRQQVEYATDVQTATGLSASAVTGKITMNVDSRTDVWVDGSHSMVDAGGAAAAVARRPDQIGLGASYRIFDRLRLEAVHHQLWIPGDSSRYSLTTARLRADGLFGGSAWGGVDRTSEARASHSAVLGFNQRLAITHGWSAYSMFERHLGLDRAAALDPMRALPFAQLEPDRWTAAGGLDWVPGSDRARLTTKAEYRDGADRKGDRVELAADLPLGAAMAFVTYHDWSQYRQAVNGATTTAAAVLGGLVRSERSAVGFALRPATWDALNALTKLEWRRTAVPLNAMSGIGATPGDDRRLIGATDVIWSTDPSLVVSGRYALRWAEQTPIAAAAVKSRAQYAGLRADRELRGPFLLRVDGRLLLEQTSRTTSWNASPSLVAHLDSRIELEGGYRFGDLVDRDFAANGGRGLFAALSVRFTERALAGPGAFWRERIARTP